MDALVLHHTTPPRCSCPSAVNLVSRLFPTAIVSGRARHKVEAFVQLDHLMYAGSHGLDIAAPTIGNNGAKGEDGHALVAHDCTHAHQHIHTLLRTSPSLPRRSLRFVTHSSLTLPLTPPRPPPQRPACCRTRRRSTLRL